MEPLEDPTVPPRAAIREVKDVYFGREIVDPYRWMEAPQSAELAAWMKAQDAHTRRYLDGLPARDELLARITAVSNAGESIFVVQRRGDRYFYLKLAPGDDNWKLCVRDGLAGTERTLVDTEATSSDGAHSSITWFEVSHDGLLASCLIAPSGSEYGEIRVIDVGSGRETGDRIDRTRWDAGSWLPDGRSFAYWRFQDMPSDAPPTERLKNIQVCRHALGTRPDDDVLLFGRDSDPGAGPNESLIPDVRFPLATRFAIAALNTGVSPNSAYYVAPIESLDQAQVPWRRIAGFEDEVADVVLHGDDLYALTFQDAPRFRVVRTSVASPDLATAEVVVPETEAVIERIAAARDALYVQTLDGGVTRLHRVDYVIHRSEPIQLPYDGAARLEVADVLHDGILFTLSSWTRPPAMFAYDPWAKVATDTGLIPPRPVDMSGISTVTTKVASHDGAMIPLVILLRQDLDRVAAHPALLSGYGAYGAAHTTPRYSPQFLAWLERGGIYAMAGVRGGGEYGEAWHLAGKEATKPNTWKDFIACAEYLVREGYTRPELLAGEGTSAGGILICNAIAERPDLFGAAVVHVGLTNALRMETTANGVPNIPEFGSFATEEGFLALLEMDGYHKIKPGVDYPAVLLTHGITDPRVDPWFSAKMAARLQRVSGDPQAVLLRIDYDAGHGVGSTKEQRNRREADVYAFLFDRLGGASG